MKIRPFLTLLALIATPAAAQSAFDLVDPGHQKIAHENAAECIQWDGEPRAHHGGWLTNSCPQRVSLAFQFHPQDSDPPPIGIGAPRNPYPGFGGGVTSVPANGKNWVGSHYPFTVEHGFGKVVEGVNLFFGACFGQHNFPKHVHLTKYHCEHKQQGQQQDATAAQGDSGQPPSATAKQSAFDRIDPGLQTPGATAQNAFDLADSGAQSTDATAQNPFDHANTATTANEIAAWRAAEKRRIAREKAEREERERIARLEAERKERQRQERIAAAKKKRDSGGGEAFRFFLGALSTFAIAKPDPDSVNWNDSSSVQNFLDRSNEAGKLAQQAGLLFAGKNPGNLSSQFPSGSPGGLTSVGGGGKCQAGIDRAGPAIERIQAQSQSSDAISAQVCATLRINIISEWSNLECANDPSLDATRRQQSREQARIQNRYNHEHLVDFKRHITNPGSPKYCDLESVRWTGLVSQYQ